MCWKSNEFVVAKEKDVQMMRGSRLLSDEGHIPMLLYDITHTIA